LRSFDFALACWTSDPLGVGSSENSDSGIAAQRMKPGKSSKQNSESLSVRVLRSFDFALAWWTFHPLRVGSSENSDSGIAAQRMKPGKSSKQNSESLSVRVVMNCSVGGPVASRESDTLTL
jgi:hypothetical protein